MAGSNGKETDQYQITVVIKIISESLTDAEKLIVDLLAPYNPVILSAKREKPTD